ncbi:hypothetical protein OGM63_08150 [Plectonema radiosum NIES-515]|uniref:Cas12f1-like TNB domain-containing protein n=1 Tax=Plectonema radiosum NIES-515 TaxID=2986073 RepID=A0ABT3AWI9_9CYAN|nr:hypothetical protein [Plectonema radiosum]MCV3213497.1 hypothetical protein [Plectonema radiosum NIES-515]
MQLVERHVIKKSHKYHQEIDNLCFLSKNLYNAANYLIRQNLFQLGEIRNYNQVQKLMQSSVDYKAIPAKLSQQILMVLDKNWKAFQAASKSYQKNVIGSRNNQNFVQVPHARFIDQITYKAELAGIKVFVNEESYTSLASFLDQDEIPVYKKGTLATFSGKRIQRGLYRSGSGKRINADVNGSLNILRKAIPEAFAQGIEGIVVSPVKVKLLN